MSQFGKGGGGNKMKQNKIDICITHSVFTKYISSIGNFIFICISTMSIVSNQGIHINLNSHKFDVNDLRYIITIAFVNFIC